MRGVAVDRPRRIGRRLSDPVDVAVAPGTVAVRGRLAAVSVRASAVAGAWVGFALGLAVGVVIGATVSWFAGAALDWQRDLSFTFGVARRLLPFGDQVDLLRELEARWFLVIPGIGLAIAAFAALLGAAIGGLIAASTTARHVTHSWSSNCRRNAC